MPEAEANGGAGAKSARANASVQAMESGVCIICGECVRGAVAFPSPPVRLARRLRKALGMQPKHTVACKAHLDEARGLRARYERKRKEYAAIALLFFMLAIVGGFVFGAGTAHLALAALIGAAFVAALPFFYYSPSFG